MIKVRWTAWLHPSYVWHRIKWFFGWRPEWVRQIESWKIRPEVILMTKEAYQDLLNWNQSLPERDLLEVEKIIEDNSIKEVK